MKDLKANKKVIEICSNIFYPMLALAIVLAVWAICAKAYDNPLVLPAPDVTLREFFKMFAQKVFWVNIGWSNGHCMKDQSWYNSMEHIILRRPMQSATKELVPLHSITWMLFRHPSQLLTRQ